MLSEVVTCNCVRNPWGHAESNPRPSEAGVSFYHVLRPLDLACMLTPYTLAADTVGVRERASTALLSRWAGLRNHQSGMSRK